MKYWVHTQKWDYQTRKTTKNMAKYRQQVIAGHLNSEVNIQLPADQPTLKPFLGKTSFHSKQRDLQDLVLAGQGWGHCHLHQLQTI